MFVMYNGWKRLSEYNKVGGEDNLAYSTPQGVPFWVTLNVGFSYQLNKYLQVQVAVENNLNQHYRVFASGISAKFYLEFERQFLTNNIYCFSVKII